MVCGLVLLIRLTQVTPNLDCQIRQGTLCVASLSLRSTQWQNAHETENAALKNSYECRRVSVGLLLRKCSVRVSLFAPYVWRFRGTPLHSPPPPPSPLHCLWDYRLRLYVLSGRTMFTCGIPGWVAGKSHRLGAAPPVGPPVRPLFRISVRFGAFHGLRRWFTAGLSSAIQAPVSNRSSSRSSKATTKRPRKINSLFFLVLSTSFRPIVVVHVW